MLWVLTLFFHLFYAVTITIAITADDDDDDNDDDDAASSHPPIQTPLETTTFLLPLYAVLCCRYALRPTSPHVTLALLPAPNWVLLHLKVTLGCVACLHHQTCVRHPTSLSSLLTHRLPALLSVCWSIQSLPTPRPPCTSL